MNMISTLNTNTEITIMNNNGAVFGYVVRYCHIVNVRSVFANNHITSVDACYPILNGAVPSTLRPSIDVYGPAVKGGSQYATTTVRVNTAGQIHVYTGTNGTCDYLTFNFCYTV